MFGLNWTDLVAGALIGLLLQSLIIYLENLRRSRKSLWHGTWYEVIPPQHNLQERWDRVKIKATGNRLRGTAWRIRPKEEKNRVWGFEGYEEDDRMVGFFYIVDSKIDPSSYIPITLTRDKTARHEVIWKGHYTWPAYTTPKDIMDGKMVQGTIWWQRKHPGKKISGEPISLAPEHRYETHNPRD